MENRERLLIVLGSLVLAAATVFFFLGSDLKTSVPVVSGSPLTPTPASTPLPAGPSGAVKNLLSTPSLNPIEQLLAL